MCKEHIEEMNDYHTGKGSENSSKKNTPGWNEVVKPSHEEAKFWWALWISSGRSRACDNNLFQNIKSSKAQYKYAKRRLNNSAEQIQNNAYVSSDLSGSGSIYSEVKKFRGMYRTVSSRIDEVVGSENIPNHFAHKYSDLYNKYDLGKQFEDLSNLVNSSVGEDHLEDIELIKEALKKMKSGKSDVLYEFNSDCLLNAPEALLIHLSNLFRIFLVHSCPHSSSLLTYPNCEVISEFETI